MRACVRRHDITSSPSPLASLNNIPFLSPNSTLSTHNQPYSLTAHIDKHTHSYSYSQAAADALDLRHRARGAALLSAHVVAPGVYVGDTRICVCVFVWLAAPCTHISLGCLSFPCVGLLYTHVSRHIHTSSAPLYVNKQVLNLKPYTVFVSTFTAE